jgi:N4-(beta-N-acetylglucosaminyl)-L-asparaginase
MKDWSRRKFFLATLVGGVAASAQKLFGTTVRTAGSAPPSNDDGAPEPVSTQVNAARGTRPLIVCAANGFQHLDKGMDILKKGGDTLDAVLAVVVEVENDPNDNSVGYGGLPNEEGDVELDAQVMHGPTRRAGAVGALKKIKNASLLAKCVMEKTDHIFIVGDGATRFAIAEGFAPMDLLTPKSREAWLRWKAKSSPFWAPGIDSPNWTYPAAENHDTPEKQELEEWFRQVIAHPPTGTINCLAVDAKGDISGTTTTSGMAWKIPGRVGDSPIIGAGNYVDNEVGAAGSTGRGEENIRVCGAHTVVEMMRKGMSPTDACLEALQRISHNFKDDKTRLTEFAIQFYALNKDGVHGGATLWGPAPGASANYAIHDGASAKHTPFKALYDHASKPTPKTPQ